MPKTKGSGKGKGKKETLRISRSERAGLAMPVARIHRYMKQGTYAKHIGTGGAIYLSAVLEYCVAEILELAGNASKDQHRKTINPRHIMFAIRNDEELGDLLKDVTIAHSGVVPHIEKVLLPNKDKKKGKKNSKR